MRIVEYFIALGIGVLAAAPRLDYNIPLMVNSFSWLFMVVISSLFACFFMHQETSKILKALLIYLFANCFLSQAPYLSFNAFVLIVAACYLFLIAQKCDFKVILQMCQAVFLLEVIILLIQHFGMDTLMSFDKREKIFLGTILQPMRLASMFAVLTPFLLMVSKWYLIPLMILAVCSGTLGFSLALVAGCLFYVFINPEMKFLRNWVLIGSLAFCLFCSIRTHEDFKVAITEGRLPIWWLIAKSWVLDTTQNPFGPHDIFGISQTGPFKLDKFFFGHGIDTFLPLFPVYKHDPNPFPQCHNDWLQYLWEFGIIGFGLIAAYCISLVRRLYKSGEYLLLATGIVIAVNKFFAFPDRMTQTMYLQVVFLAFCEYRLRVNRIKAVRPIRFLEEETHNHTIESCAARSR